MIRPIHPCHPGCPGWRAVKVLGITLVQPCRACWSGEVLTPGPAYYHLTATGNHADREETNQ